MAATAAQEMCFSVELLAGIENENELILIEKWATVEDHQSFIGGVIEEGGLDALMPLLDGEIETSHYRAAD